MEELLKVLPTNVLDTIKRNPELLKALNREVLETSAYQEGSTSELTTADNHRMAFLVLDYVFKSLAYPREIMADTKTGHIYFKAEDGTVLGKTFDLEQRLDTLFGDGESGATGNDIKVSVDDITAITLGTALKELVDAINATAMKHAVRCATTTALGSLSGLQTIDGIQLTAGDRVLVKDQPDKTTNGLYIAATGAWTRPKEFNGVNDVKDGCTVTVGLGNVNKSTMWTLKPFNINTPTYTFERLNRILTTKDAAADTSIVIDPIEETISLKTRHSEDVIYTKVKVTKEGIIKEGSRHTALKSETFSGGVIVASSFDQEQIPYINLGASDKVPCNGTGNDVKFNHRGINNTATGLMVQKEESGALKHFVPVTISKAVYLDNEGTTLNDVLTDIPTLEGNKGDEFLVFNFNTSALKMHQFRLMAVLEEPNEIYIADLIFKGENGMMDSKLNEFTESSGRPDIKIYNSSVVVDLKNVKSYCLYNSFYGTIYSKYVEGQNNLVGKYAKINSTNPGLLPSHTSVADLRAKLANLNSLFSSIGGRLTFATNEEVNTMFDEILGYDTSLPV